MPIDLDAIFASSASPHVLFDRHLRMIWANDAYVAVTGRTRAQIIGRILTEKFPAPPDAIANRMLKASFKHVFENGVTDATAAWELHVARNLKLHGHPTGQIYTARRRLRGNCARFGALGLDAALFC